MQIAFWTSVQGLGGNSSITSVVAATLALEKKMNTVIVDNARKQSRLNILYKQTDKINHPWDAKGGIDGILQLARVDKLNSTNILNYSKTLIKHARLDIFEDGFECENTSFLQNKEAYVRSINCLNEAYDVVCFDVKAGLSNDLSNCILECSDIIIVSLHQNKQHWSELVAIIKESNIFLNKQIIFVISKYDCKSRIKLANIRREYKLNNMIAIPYNVEFMDSYNLGKVIDYLLRNYKCSKEDDNFAFMSQVKELVEITTEAIEEGT